MKGKKLVMLGLDNSGKTTLLYLVSRGQFVPAISTIGYNPEIFTFQKATYTLFDFGGKNIDIHQVREYFVKAKGVIFAIDASDRKRLEQSYKLFCSILQEDHFQGLPILIFLCKSDLENPITEEEIKNNFNLLKLSNIHWFV